MDWELPLAVMLSLALGGAGILFGRDHVRKRVAQGESPFPAWVVVTVYVLGRVTFWTVVITVVILALILLVLMG